MDVLKQFESAILYAQVRTDPALAQQADEFCNQIKRSPEATKLCLQLLGQSQHATVQFHCLSTLADLAKSSHLEMLPSDERDALRASAMRWVQAQLPSAHAMPPFLQNKVAVLVALLVHSEFPDRWPAAFTDLLSWVRLGRAPVLLAQRVLEYVEEEIVRNPTEAREVERMARFKDAMREVCVPQLVEAWYELIAAHREPDPLVARRCLRAMRGYVDWIDVRLVANDRFLPLLFACLQSPPLMRRAAEVLLDLAQKGMPALAKLQMLQMMDLPAALQRITVPTAEDEETAALALAQLVAGVGMVLLECWKHVGQEQGFASEAAVAAAAQLHRIMPLAWSLIGHELCSVGLAALELAQAAVSSMRESWAAEAAAAAAAAGRTFWLAEQLPLLLDMVLRRVRYPPSYAFGAAQPSEEMEEFDQLRERLRHLFSRLAVLSGERVLTFLAAVFSSALPAASLGALPFHDVEAALTLLGALAEKGVDVGQDALAVQLRALVDAVLRGSAASHAHPLVAQAYFELAMRFSSMLVADAALLQLVLAALLGDNGVKSWHPALHSRACYIVLHLTESTLAALSPLAAPALRQLAPLLTLPAPSGARVLRAEDVAPTSRLQLFEAAGRLITAAPGPPASQPRGRLVEEVAAPLLDALRAAVQPAEQAGAAGAAGAGMHNEPWAAAALACFAHLLRGLHASQRDSTPASVAEFVGVMDAGLRAATAALRAFPGAGAARQRVVLMLHTVISGAGDALLPHLAQPLLALTGPRQSCIASGHAQQLLTKLASQCKASAAPVADELLLPTLSTCMEAVAGPEEDAAAEAEARQRALALIQTLATCKLGHVFWSERNLPRLNDVLELLIKGSVEVEDYTVNRSALSALRSLVLAWLPPPGAAAEPAMPPPLREQLSKFLVERALPAALQCPFRPFFNVSDARSIQVLNGCAALLLTTAQRVGAPAEAFICERSLPAAGCPPSLVAEFRAKLAAGQEPEFQQFFKQFVRKGRAQ